MPCCVLAPCHLAQQGRLSLRRPRWLALPLWPDPEDNERPLCPGVGACRLRHSGGTEDTMWCLARRNKSLEELRKFFDYDRKVLRFFCVWDDRRNLYGDNIPYVLHYYLSDDTVEVNEVHARNTGRDSFPKVRTRGWT